VELRAACAVLMRHVGAAAAAPAPGDPARRAALRTLLVHDWRRIALRAPDLPDALAPPDWTGAETRAAVRALLDRLGPQAAP
jgi:phenylacetic acid degradation operon negative regulatory protein